MEAEAFIQATLDALSAHIAILDDTGQIIGVNAAWRDFGDSNGFRGGGYGLGTNYLNVCDAAAQRKSPDAPVIAGGIRDIMRGRLDEFEMEYPCHSPLERRWFVVRVSRFEWYDDVRLIVAHQNVSELKQVQTELEQSKQRIEAILDNINNGIITIDASGTIETANRAAARIFGFDSPDDLIGTPIGNLLNEPFNGRTTLKQLNGEYGHEITGRRQSGDVFPMYFSLNELKLNTGSIYTCIIQDITYRKRMEAEILERERMTVALEKERELRELKNRFLVMMGHELKTPLTSISLAYDSLKIYGDRATKEENDQALDSIRLQVDHLREMVDDVLTISRAELDGLQIDREDLDLITTCRDVVEGFVLSYHRTHTIEFDCPDNEIRAQLDRKMIRRVFTNLLSNAIKYSPEGSTVGFYLHQDSETSEAVIQVSDSGIGIPAEDQPRLFEPFHRASNVRSINGTGLGLAIVKQAVDAHNGHITFESSTEQGTTFIIRLPLSS